MLDVSAGDEDGQPSADGIRRLPAGRPALRVVRANVSEIQAHEKLLERMGEACLWPGAGQRKPEA
jgi:DNA polymerase III subunit epsilon